MSKPDTVAIIQARMGSKRLPGKVLLDIAGQPMLAHVVQRTRLAGTIDRVIVATTTDDADEPVASFCKQNGYSCFRGDLHDVLDRYYQTARSSGARVIVRITADCPLIDPAVIDRTVQAFFGATAPQDQLLSGDLALADASIQIDPDGIRPTYDFVANRLPPPYGRTYPIGLDTEVCSFEGLETAWREAKQPYQREHVMPFFYDNLDRFRVLLVNSERDLGSLRWTVDTPQDLELLRRIFEFFPGREDFSWLEVLDLVERQPDLAQINAQVSAKDYRQYDERRPH